MNLYMYYVGGTVDGANIEAHDVQFAIADRPEAAFQTLADRWFGSPDMLHVDVITRIGWVDGHDVVIGEGPGDPDRKLFFVNMGGYLPGEAYERHSFELFVAADENEAKAKAKRKFLADHILPHRDYLLDVDGCIALSEVDGVPLSLRENANGSPDLPLFQGYKAIGVNYTAYDPVADILIDLPQEG